MAAWLLTSISNGNQLPAPCDFPPRPETPPTTLAAVPGDKPAPFRRQMSRPYLSLAPQRYLVRLRAARYRVALAGDGALFRSRRASPASSRSPVPLPGSIRVSGRIWCTRVHQTLPEARIHPANVVAVAWGTQGLSGRRAGVIRAERSAAPHPDGTAEIGTNGHHGSHGTPDPDGYGTLVEGASAAPHLLVGSAKREGAGVDCCGPEAARNALGSRCA
jgi:hypothetical protein